MQFSMGPAADYLFLRHPGRPGRVYPAMISPGNATSGSSAQVGCNIWYPRSLDPSGAAPHMRIFPRGNIVNRKQQFIERRPQGDYAVRKPNSDRASVVKPTQAEAIDWAKAHNPDGGEILVERVTTPIAAIRINGGSHDGEEVRLQVRYPKTLLGMGQSTVAFRVGRIFSRVLSSSNHGSGRTDILAISTSGQWWGRRRRRNVVRPGVRADVAQLTGWGLRGVQAVPKLHAAIQP